MGPQSSEWKQIDLIPTSITIAKPTCFTPMDGCATLEILFHSRHTASYSALLSMTLTWLGSISQNQFRSKPNQEIQ